MFSFLHPSCLPPFAFLPAFTPRPFVCVPSFLHPSCLSLSMCLPSALMPLSLCFPFSISNALVRVPSFLHTSFLSRCTFTHPSCLCLCVPQLNCLLVGSLQGSNRPHLSALTCLHFSPSLPNLSCSLTLSLFSLGYCIFFCLFLLINQVFIY